MRSVCIIIALFWLVPPAFGEDLRVAAQKAKANLESALIEAQESETRIVKDRQRLSLEFEKAEKRVDSLKSRISDLQRRYDELEARSDAQTLQQSDESTDWHEYRGVVRQVAEDLASMLSQSQFTAFFPHRQDDVEALLSTDRFPGIGEIDMLSEQFFKEMVLSAEVDLHTDVFIARDGTETEGTLLTIGGFCAVYQKNDETGFLQYNEASRKFHALAKLPPWTMRRNLKDYLTGASENISFDVSKGAALKQLTHRSSLRNKIENGGPIVWPILGIGLLSVIIALERLHFLNRVHTNTDRLMGRVNQLAGSGDWAACEKVLRHQEGKPVYNVLRAGLGAVHEKREILESVLQEAILKELPRLERFLPALNILGAVAPLLGLLGTVTGMIETFQTITLYGTGDPRMMSGGISEALITTMLGLAVAIPIMLVHTFLRRRLEHIVGDMEEKAVALSNVICRECALEPALSSEGNGSTLMPMRVRV